MDNIIIDILLDIPIKIHQKLNTIAVDNDISFSTLVGNIISNFCDEEETIIEIYESGNVHPSYKSHKLIGVRR